MKSIDWNLTKEDNQDVTDLWRYSIGPPEPAIGPLCDCPLCGGKVLYGAESDRFVCIQCWAVFTGDDTGG